MYTLSTYNHIIDDHHNTSVIVFNTFSGAIVSLDVVEHAALLNHANCDNDDLISSFVEAGLLVPKDSSERSIIDFDRENSIHSKDNVTFRILTTTECNATCFYCYEEDVGCDHMSLEVADGVVDFIVAKTKNTSKVTIEWFGGEPLLNPKIISQITCKLEEVFSKRSIQRVYRMATNGSLFDNSLVKLALQKWHLQNVQITLDGDRDEYNSRKNYTNVSNAFDRVISNIQLLLDNRIGVALRLNYDGNNLDSVLELITFLGDRFKGYRHLQCYAYPIFGSYSCHLVNDSFSNYNDRTTPDDLLRITKALRDNQLASIDFLGNLKYRPSKCFACNYHSFTIAPNGELYKCSFDLKHSVGSILEGIRLNSTHLKWLESGLENECIECIFLPICQGGCRASYLNLSPDRCFSLKGIVDDLIKIKVRG
jgi:radical SAM protein with 4Fe4S-binding SPASM domain